MTYDVPPLRRRQPKSPTRQQLALDLTVVTAFIVGHFYIGYPWLVVFIGSAVAMVAIFAKVRPRQNRPAREPKGFVPPRRRPRWFKVLFGTLAITTVFFAFSVVSAFHYGNPHAAIGAMVATVVTILILMLLFTIAKRVWHA